MNIFKKIIIILFCFLVSSTAFAAGDVSRSLRGSVRNDPVKSVEDYLKNEQYTDAMLELNKLLVAYPNDPKVYVLGAELLRKTGQLNEAEKMAKDALKLDFKNSAAYTALGYIYMDMALASDQPDQKQENLRNGFDHLFMASQYDPGNPMPHIGLAEAYSKNMQRNKAKDEILKAQELSFRNPEALYEIGQYYYKTNEYDKSEKYIEKSVRAGRNSYYRAHYTLGTILEHKGEIKEAQQSYLAALRLKPDLVEAQERLDALIKLSYKENQAQTSTTQDLFETVNENLRNLMKADYYLMLDQYTEARDLYIKLLEKDPKNISAVAGLAELYYLKWRAGYVSSGNYTSDAIYIIKAKPNNMNEIALLKFQMINEQKIPEKVRQRLINLSITESFEYYDLLNEIRAEFLLGNYEECHSKLLRLLEMKLSNYEKFKVLKHLTYDNNYYEAMIVLQELKKTYYHNEEIEPVEKRIRAKFQVAEDKVNEALELFKEKQYSATIPIYEQVINYFPTYKPVYLHYARTLEKMENYEAAYSKINTYQKLYNLYPEDNPEVSESEIKAIIDYLYKKMKEQINPKKI